MADCKVQRPISVPEPTNEVDSLWRTTQVLKEVVEVMQGIRGNREYALKCDLDDLSSEVTNITIVGGGSGTGLEFGGAQYDILYNVDGTTWGPTSGGLQWNTSEQSLRLANDYSVNWLNGASQSVEFLAIEEDAFIVGDPNYPIHLDGSQVNMENDIPFTWEDTFDNVLELLNFTDQFYVGSPFYPTRLDGTLIELANDIGINWLNSAAADVELLNFNPVDQVVAGNLMVQLDFEDGTEGGNTTTNLGLTADPVFLASSEIRAVAAASGSFGAYIWTADIGGTGPQMSIAANGQTDPFGMRLNDYTIAFDVQLRETAGAGFLLECQGTTQSQWAFAYGSGTLQFNRMNGGTTVLLSITGVSLTTWHHIAVVKEGNTLYMFHDGVLSDTYDATGEAWSTQDQTLLTAGRFQSEYIDNVLLVKNQALWTATFTPPTTSIPTIIETFTAGDPAYATVIDGLTTNITSAATDIDGTLNLGGAATFLSTLDVVGAVTGPTFNGQQIVIDGTVDGQIPIWDQTTDGQYEPSTNFRFIDSAGRLEFYGGGGATFYGSIAPVAGANRLQFKDPDNVTALEIYNSLAVTYRILRSQGPFFEISDQAGNNRVKFDNDTEPGVLHVSLLTRFQVDADLGVVGQAIGAKPAAVSGTSIIWGVNEAGTHLQCVSEDDVTSTLENNHTCVWRFNTPTASGDPAATLFRTNNATPALVTALYVDDLDLTSVDAGWFLSTVEINDILTLRTTGGRDKYLTCLVTSVTDNVGWWTFGVTVLFAGATNFTNTNPVQFELQKTSSGGYAADALVVHLAGTETITGAKTFDSAININSDPVKPLTGTVSVTIGTAAVTGVGTAFTAECRAGSVIKIADEVFKVLTQSSNTALTLDSNHAAGAAGVPAYTDNNPLSIYNGDGDLMYQFTSGGTQATSTYSHAEIGNNGTYSDSVGAAWSTWAGLSNDSSGTYIEIKALGTATAQTYYDSSHVLGFSPAAGPLYIGDSGADARYMKFELATNKYVNVEDGTHLRIWDGTEADNVDLYHDGTDFNTAFTTTTDWNITGITSIQAGTVDADFDAITATSYGGINEADLVDLAATETITGAWTFSAALTGSLDVSGKTVTSTDYYHLRTETQTNLALITATVNTDAGKVAGAMVWDITNGQPVWAAGDTDGALWVDGAGTTVHTPI